MNRIQVELSSLQHRQQLLSVMVFSLVTILVWVAISLITSQTTRKISTEQQTLAKSLNPNINEAAIARLELKRSYSESELSAFPLYTLKVEDRKARTVTPTASPAASSSSLRSVLEELNQPTAPSPTSAASPAVQASPSPTADATGIPPASPSL